MDHFAMLTSHGQLVETVFALQVSEIKAMFNLWCFGRTAFRCIDVCDIFVDVSVTVATIISTCSILISPQ